MTLRIEIAFGMPMDTLLRMQVLYDSHTMRERASDVDMELYDSA